MQKKYMIGLLICASVLFAAPTNETNIVKNQVELKKIVQTSFPATSPLFDGVISSQEKYAAVVPAEDQRIILQLSHPFYVRQIKVYADKQLSPKSVTARYSRDSYDWVSLTNVKIEETADSRVFTINAENALAPYLLLSFVANPGTAKMVIQEIEIYPQMDLRLRAYHIKDKWQTTDTEAFDDIDTKIDVFKFWTFSEVGAPADQKFTKKPSPTLEGETISAGGLKPGTSYEYKMSLTDYNGNILDLPVRQFSTKPKSFASGATCEGTFAGLSSVTDGSTDLKGMGVSGIVSAADQYIIVDLGAVKQISEVVTMWRQLGYPKDFSIQISQDKVTWKTVQEHLNADTVTTARSAEGHPIKPMFVDFDKTAARYVKILIPKGSALFSKHANDQVELLEVKVF